MSGEIPLHAPDGSMGEKPEIVEPGGSTAHSSAHGLKRGLRVAIEGCCHGELEKIYASIEETNKRNNFEIDLLLICGDFQAVRNEQDLNCMAVPQKYRTLNSFYKYYSGELTAPVLTIFVGGNHEASNHLWELYHGGWVAPNIFFLGYSGVVHVGGIRIAGLSGIFKGNHYRQGHWERPPYDDGSMRSAYHVREFEVWKLQQVTGHVDVFLSHDWPQGVHRHGNERNLLRTKRFLEKEVQTNTLGNPHTAPLLAQLQPSYWFAAHLHTKFAALVRHGRGEEGVGELARMTRFLSLDKCLPNRDFLQVIEFAEAERGAPLKVAWDPEWLAIVRLSEPFRSLDRRAPPLPPPSSLASQKQRELAWVSAAAAEDPSFLTVPANFAITLPPHQPGVRLPHGQPPFQPSPQTAALVAKLQIPMPHEPPLNPAAPGASHAPVLPFQTLSNPEEIDLDDDEDEGGQPEPNPDEIALDEDD